MQRLNDRYSHPMSLTEVTPRLLPGISASAWRTVLQVVTWVTAASIIMPFAATIFHLGHGPIFDWFYPIFAAIALNYVAIFIAGARSKKEAAAGYTTLWRSHPTLPQLDQTTGALIRQAGQPYTKKADWKNGSNPTYEKDSSEITKPTLWQRLLPALPGWIGITVVILVSGAFGRLAEGVGQVVGLTISVSVLALAILANVIAAFVNRGRLARMRAVAPGDFVFLFASSKQFRSEAAALQWQGDVEGAFKPRGVSADRVGLTFWRGKPFEQAATLPWGRILSVQDDRLQNGNSWQPAVLISYKDEADDIQALPLANANADLAPLRSMPEVRWIASELNALRTGSPTKRVL
jgi:hypothetical protein